MTPDVFLDTVGMLAVWDEDDQWHDAAEAAFLRLASVGAQAATTIYVLAECGNAAARRPFRLAVDTLREELSAAGKLITPTDEDWRKAWSAYRRGEAAQAGFVDQLSFAVMRRLGMTEAFTNDRHFKAAGFTTLF